MLIEDNAFVLFTRPQGETSLWLSVLTHHHGRLSLVYKGGQKKSAACAPFQPLVITWKSSNRGAWLSSCEVIAFYPRLTGMANWSGLYANELLHKGLRESAETSSIFTFYQQLLNAFFQKNITPAGMALALRRFEWRILTALGYGFGFTTPNGLTLENSQFYCWHQDKWQECDTGILGAEILSLTNEDETNVVVGSAMRQLLQWRLLQVMPTSAMEMRQWWQKI